MNILQSRMYASNAEKRRNKKAFNKSAPKRSALGEYYDISLTDKDKEELWENRKKRTDKVDKLRAKKRRGEIIKTVGARAAGAGVGLGISQVATIKIRKKVKELSTKQRTPAEDIQLKALKNKLTAIRIGSSLGGAVLGGAAYKKYRK